MQSNFIPQLKTIRKWHKVSNSGVTSNYNFITNGEIALVAVNYGRLFSTQLQRLKLILARTVKKRGQYWLPTFSHIPLTKKGSNARMGKGKGAINSWVAPIRPNTIIITLAGLPSVESTALLSRLRKQLPFGTRIVQRYKTLVKRKETLSAKIIPF